MSRKHITARLAFFIAAMVAGTAQAIPQTSPPAASTQPSSLQPVYHYEWENVSISATRDLRSGKVQREASMQGRINFDRAGALSMVSYETVLTDLKVNGKTQIHDPSAKPPRIHFR